jgi:arginyl-tRNA synthetase
MSVIEQIKVAAAKAIEELYKVEIGATSILVNATKPEFEGDYTVVLFAFVKQLKKSPDELGKELGEYLISNNAYLFTDFNVIKGFSKP